MKQRFVDDLKNTAVDIASAFNKLSELNTLAERFKNGEPLQIKLTLGDIELSERVMMSNGQNCYAEDFFAMCETTLRKTIEERICDLQTISEAESAE